MVLEVRLQIRGVALLNSSLLMTLHVAIAVTRRTLCLRPQQVRVHFRFDIKIIERWWYLIISIIGPSLFDWKTSTSVWGAMGPDQWRSAHILILNSGEKLTSHQFCCLIVGPQKPLICTLQYQQMGSSYHPNVTFFQTSETHDVIAVGFPKRAS